MLGAGGLKLANGNGSGNAWKITGVVLAALLSFGAYMYGRMEDRVSANTAQASAIEKKHSEDTTAMRERMIATETFQKEVLRRLERIEQKLEK